MSKQLIQILSIALLCYTASTIQAQSYKAAVGARLGTPISASLKTFVSEKNAFEVYVGFRGNSGTNTVSINGAYLVHHPLDEIIDGLQWYAGGGAGAYFWSNDFLGNEIYFGVQGYGGLDYKVADAPVNITADWSPTFFIGDGFLTGFASGYYSLAVRYVFK